MSEEEIEQRIREAKAEGRREALEELGEALKGLDLCSVLRPLAATATKLEAGLLELRVRNGDLGAAATLYEGWKGESDVDPVH